MFLFLMHCMTSAMCVLWWSIALNGHKRVKKRRNADTQKPSQWHIMTSQYQIFGIFFIVFRMDLSIHIIFSYLIFLLMASHAISVWRFVAIFFFSWLMFEGRMIGKIHNKQKGTRILCARVQDIDIAKE